MKISPIFIALLLLMSLVQATPLSVLEPSVIQYSDGTQNIWKVIMRGDRSSDYVMFVQPTELKSEGVQSENGFKLESTIVSEKCSYSLISDDARPDFYTYSIADYTGIWPWQVDDIARNKCSNSELIWARGFGTYTVHCLNKELVGISGRVLGGRMDFSSKFTLTGPDGYSQTKLVNSLGMESEKNIPSSVTFTDEDKTIASVKWIGGAVFGEFCPDKDAWSAVQSVANVWYTASEDAYLRYMVDQDALEDKIDALENILLTKNKQVIEPWPVADDNVLRAMIKEAETEKNSALQRSTMVYLGVPATFSGASTSLDLGRDHLLFAPDFEISINADWLKLVYLVGKPDITKISYRACIEGSVDNLLDVTVANVGDAQGKFLADITCEEGIVVRSTEASITLNPGESGTVSIPFDVALIEDNSRQCKVTFKDSNNQDNKDSKSLTMDCISEKFCSPDGLKRCVGEIEQKCDAGNWVQTDSTECKAGNECDKDGICDFLTGESFEKCGGKSASVNDCATCNSDGACDSTETVYSCQKDCGTIPPWEPPQWIWIGFGIMLAVIMYKVLEGRKKK